MYTPVMTLRRKMALQISAMIVGLLLVSGAAIWGINALEQDYGAAVAGYQELREIYEVGAEVKVAQMLLSATPPDTAGAAESIRRASERMQAMETAGAPHPRLAANLREARADLDVAKHIDQLAVQGAVSKVLAQIPETASQVGKQIQERQQVALERRRKTTFTVGTLAGAVIAAAILLGTWQYRGVLNPLRRLSGAVRRVARGQFGVRILEGGMPSGADNEFAGLAADFNRMAQELDEFYRELEQKVAAKSKELVQSERLASVGFLAAGVAHEINNPLGIISGYAEYALAEAQSGRPESQKEIDATLRVIRDEAFRCKDITGKLLSLARPGDTKRQRVDLEKTAEQVVSMLGALRDFKERTITVRADVSPLGEALVVDAVEGEMKQVLMNLIINALEATDDVGGEVRVNVAGDPDGRVVTVSVVDNGRGMTPETLERVFEPFYTDRRQRDPSQPARPGTGLGLSITHAIVQSHGGRITAQSDGPGRGSKFVVELPAARAHEPSGAA
jgi:signal transduction histidine kinase